MVETIEVGHIGELVDVIRAIRRTTRYGLPLWFRGQGNAEWSVQAALWREGGPRGRFSAADERNFTHRFRTRAAIRYPNTPGYEDHAAWLSLMQHYGLPTRLLDWSRSPLVAAYFATQAYLRSDEGRVPDVAIWVLSPHELNRSFAGIDVTPAIGSRECAHLVGAAFRDARPSTRAGRTGPIMAAMATELDLRMFVQQGSFTVHAADAISMETDPNSAKHLWCLRVPREAVTRLAGQLEDLGVRRGDLFPDLQHLAEELVDSYPPGSVWATKGD